MFAHAESSEQENKVVADDKQNHCYNIEDLVMHIQDILNKEDSKKNVTNIIVENNESEGFYALKNFSLMIEIIWFVFKETFFLAIIMVICFLLYRYYEKIKNICVESFFFRYIIWPLIRPGN